MCQQWLSVVGLMMDLVGFGLIAFEWHKMFTREIHFRQMELSDAHEKMLRAMQDDREPGFLHSNEEMLMAKEFSKLYGQEVTRRAWLFFGGAGLIVAGFLLQAAGSWPRGLWGLGSC